MSRRSKKDAYESALTDRFTNLPTSEPPNLHSVEELRHDPLQDPATELRFLYLLPKRQNVVGNEQNVVRCELTTGSREHWLSYVGLSYTWGDPQIRRPILVGERIFLVTENLADTLEHLQEEDKTLVLWVDAVCIDQENLHEKSVQVQRMGDIFASASMVVAWLGVSADGSDVALKELGKYDERESFRTALIQVVRDPTNTNFPVEQSKALFERQWFKRVWVGHEVVVNEVVIFVCGLYDTDRESLMWSSTLISKLAASLEDPVELMLSTRLFHCPRESFNEFQSIKSRLNAIDGDFKVCDTHEADKMTIYEMSIWLSPATHLLEEVVEGDSFYKSYRTFRGIAEPPENTSDPQSWRRDASRAYLWLLKNFAAKQLFITCKGHVGLSSDFVRSGEWVYQVASAEGTCVLREVGEGVYRIASVAHISPIKEYKDIDAPEETITII